MIIGQTAADSLSISQGKIPSDSIPIAMWIYAQEAMNISIIGAQQVNFYEMSKYIILKLM
jgi:ferritin-like metal-binding protein YciE